MPKGIPRNPKGRRDRILPGDKTQIVTLAVSAEGVTRFKLMYPRAGALRLLLNAAMRAALERPDLCPWLKTSYGKHAAGIARFRDHAKVEHPMRDITASDFILEPVPEDQRRDRSFEIRDRKLRRAREQADSTAPRDVVIGGDGEDGE